MSTITKIEANQRSATIQMLSMDIELDLSGAGKNTQKTFESYARLTFIPSVSDTFIDIIAQEIEQVRINGLEHDFNYDGYKLFISGLLPEEENVVEVSAKCFYSITGEGLHRYFDPEDDKVYLYSHYEPTSARRVYACFDQPDIKAVWNFKVSAPNDWIVLSNGAKVYTEQKGQNTTHSFAPTPKLSAYITAVIAGQYHQITDKYKDPNTGQEIDLGLYCRQSLAPYFDYEDFIDVTKKGFEFYNKNYGLAYPWGKYDQILVPEYNLGAMENPGCVTFTEKYIFKNKPTKAGRQARANTILHEMCHMWFGDLVTPKWWDDLWLKESFADHQGTYVSAEVTEHKDAWATFACRRKAWAYEQDSLPTTHPIIADIVDVEAAAENFDGITYAKGASVLKQLVAWVGVEKFFEAARIYFKDNSYCATTLTDLTKALEQVSDKDFDSWIQKWLQTTNASVITPQILCDNGEITRLCVHQECKTPEADIIRPHQIKIGLYRLQGQHLQRYECIDVELNEQLTEIEQARSMPEPDLLLLNDEDLTYAIVRMDPKSISTVVSNLHKIESALTRSIVWSSLFNHVRDNKLATSAFVQAVINNLGYEQADAVVETVLSQTQTVVSYTNPARQDGLLVQLANFSHDMIEQATSYDLKRVWAGAYIEFASKLKVDSFFDEQAQHKQNLIDIVQDNVQTLPVDMPLKWAAARVLAIYNVYTLDDLDQLKAQDPSGDGAISYLCAKSSILGEGVKEELFERICTDMQVSNDQLLALLKGFNTHLSDSQKLYFAQKYFEKIDSLWNERTIVMGRHVANYLYPTPVYDDNPIVESNPVITMTHKWLSENTQANHILRKKMVENCDLALRMLRCQRNN